MDWTGQAQVPSIVRDGAPYDPHLDRFFADLPLSGVRSQHSLRSYAYDLLVWVRFLDEARAKTVWQATRDDVDAYHRARRHDEAANRISAASWGCRADGSIRVSGVTLIPDASGPDPSLRLWATSGQRAPHSAPSIPGHGPTRRAE
jgi:hypothetical protein